jgi:DNA-binding transcriptional regulator GbsR (MarR family)
MTKLEKQAVDEVRDHLVDVIGRTTQDIGLGRIVGQVLAYIYLCERDCSLDEIGDELGLSKAAVSIATRQLESLGLLQKVWKRGDRKHYYRLVKQLGVAVRKGILSMLRAKVGAVGAELDHASEILEDVDKNATGQTDFVRQRLQRAQRLKNSVEQILNSPLLKMLGR